MYDQTQGFGAEFVLLYSNIYLHSLVNLVEGTTKCNKYEMTADAPCWPIITIDLGDSLLVVSHNIFGVSVLWLG